MQSINIDLLINNIDNELIVFFNNEIRDDVGMSLNEYIVSLNLPYRDYIEDPKISRRDAKKARIRTRLNWYNAVFRDFKKFNPNGTSTRYYNYLKTYIAPDLTWEGFIEEYTDIVKEWRENDRLLIEFPFLRTCTIKTKESAFTKELILNIIDVLEKNIEGLNIYSSYDKGVFFQPLEFLLGPFVSVNSPGVLLTNKEITSDGIPIVYNDYNVPFTKDYGSLVIRSILDTSDITDRETNLRSLSAFDVSLFLYIVNFVCDKDYSTFLQTRKFQNNLSDIVRAMYPNELKPSSRCYSNVRKSLVKLSALNIKGIRGNEVVSVINFFDSYKLDTDGSGRQIVTLSVGSYMYERIATKKIQHLYSHEVERIYDKSAQFVYYLFEGERQKAYATNRITVEQEYNYTFFLHTMRFPVNATVKSNMDLIDNIFKLFVELDIVFTHYERKPKCFVVKFKPFSKEDIIKLKLKTPTLLSSV